MSPGLEIVRYQEFEHEEEKVDRQGDEHCFVLNVFLGVQSGLWSPPPDIGSNYRSNN